VNTQTASAPRIDERTAAAIRDALAAAQRGQIDQACTIAEGALASGADPIAINALLGSLRLRIGRADDAVRNLEIAHRGRPSDVRIASNLASALVASGSFERAFEVASRERALADPTLHLARIRGFVADHLQDFAAAVEALEHVVRTAPQDWESWNNLGNAQVQLGDFNGAIASLQQAVALAPEAAPSRLNLARAYRLSGDVQKSEEILRKMADDFPDDTKPLIDLHDLLKVQLRDEEIGPVLDRALALAPDNLDLLVSRAQNFGSLLEMQKGEVAFREVLGRDPTNADAYIGLATLYEHFRPAVLEDLAQEAERNRIAEDAMSLVQAFAHRRAKRYEEGAAALARLAPEFEAGRREHLLGQMLEGLGDYDGAFAAFERMNAIYCEDPSRPLERAAALRDEVRRNMAATTSEWRSSWATPPMEAERPAPAFIVGFPRSGTTLLDTILMGHPDVVVMEERPVINRLAHEVGGFEAIAAMTEPQIRAAQQRYFEIAGEYADLAPRQLLVDKSPMLTNEAAFIYRLFPGAPFILALRNPADVVLSCFVSNFRLNNAMANFIRLDTAAEFYDLTFANWEKTRAVLPLDIRPIVYEQMVEDPSGIIRPLVEGLGLAWHGDMLDHTKTAANRGIITTVSYAQVTEPIYRRSVGRWERYRKHLAPILPVLQPWAEKFGYTL
jgi:tetratricopeptide (TPR) repeat protein